MILDEFPPEQQVNKLIDLLTEVGVDVGYVVDLLRCHCRDHTDDTVINLHVAELRRLMDSLQRIEVKAKFQIDVASNQDSLGHKHQSFIVSYRRGCGADGYTYLLLVSDEKPSDIAVLQWLAAANHDSVRDVLVSRGLDSYVKLRGLPEV